MSKTTADFVVYVRFPSSTKEYCYLCNIPGIGQGDSVIANGTEVQIIRTGSYDNRATKYVRPIPDLAERKRETRRGQIKQRLLEIESEQKTLDRWAELAKKNPEAKKLLAELKRL